MRRKDTEEPMGKAAAPDNAAGDVNEDVFEAAVCMGISDDMDGSDGVDKNARNTSAFMKVAEQLAGEIHASDLQETLHMTHGPMLTQITPLYMSLLYPFLFPSGSGCPDIYGVPHRDSKQPTVDLVKHWGKCIIQRAEGQHRRDLTFPHALWQLIFKTTINVGSHLVESIKRTATQTNEDGHHKYNAKELT
jgi:hypothetical protein